MGAWMMRDIILPGKEGTTISQSRWRPEKRASLYLTGASLSFHFRAMLAGLGSLRMPDNQCRLPWRAPLLRLHFDGSRRCWVFSGGRMSGYGVMLCLCGFPLVVLGSQPFRIMLEMLFVLFLLCFVGHRAVYGRYSH